MGEPGTDFDTAELDQWEAQQMIYFSKGQEPLSVESQKKRQKAAEKEPRLASRDQLKAWQNTLFSHYAKHLGSFPAGGDGLLMLCFDSCGTNLCPFYFLRNKLHIMVECAPDNYHNRMNDAGGAVDEAGYRLVEVKAHIRNNLSYGPWQGKGYMGYLKDGAADMKNSFKESEPLLQKHWLRIGCQCQPCSI